MELNELRYRRALASDGLSRGKIQQPILPSTLGFKEVIIGGHVCAIIGGLCIYAFEWVIGFRSHMAEQVAFVAGLLILFYIILKPFISLIWQAIRQRAWPDFTVLKQFSAAHRFIATAVLMFYMSVIVDTTIYPWIVSSTEPSYSHSTNHSKSTHVPKRKARMEVSSILMMWLILTVLTHFALNWYSNNQSFTTKRQRNLKNKKVKNTNNIPFGLWLGESTGNLAQLSHGSNLAPNQQVGLFHEDLTQNVLILGAIGSGKTTRAVHPLLIQLLDQLCGGLIFDIKGDFHRAVETFAKKTGRNYRILGPNREPFNLLAGLSPEIAASFLKSAFLLSGSGRLDNFWIDTATELCRNALGILALLPEHYHLHGLYSYLFDESWKTSRLREIEVIAVILEEKQKRLLMGYQNYEAQIFNGFDEKVKAGVKATIAQVLSPFNHPDLIDAFCTENFNTARLEAMLDGEVFLVDLPLARWGLGGKVAYTFIKLRFFNMMQNRTQQLEWDQNRYVFFLCDEFQEIVSANKDGLSDLNFWDKSRSSKTIGIISAQSVSSFYAAIGDRDLTSALLQNFRQKICFRTEDQNTIDMLNRLLGKVEVAKITLGQSESTTSGWESNRGSSVSVSTQEKSIIDGQFVRTLAGNYAIALLSFNSMSFDDVLHMQPIYVQ